MFYLRLSLARPIEGREAEIRRIVDDLLSHFSGEEGFVKGYRLSACDGGREAGRITLWKSEEAAERAATGEHVMALRSKILNATEEERVEMAFEASELP